MKNINNKEIKTFKILSNILLKEGISKAKKESDFWNAYHDCNKSNKAILDEMINQVPLHLIGEVDILVSFEIYNSVKHLIVKGMYRGFRIVC